MLGRPMGHGFRVMVRARAALLLLCVALPLFAAVPKKPTPLPLPSAVDSTLKSVEEAIGAVHVSGPHAFKSTCPRVLAGSDLIAVEEQAIRDFLAGTGRFAGLDVPASRKRIVMVRYTMSDARVIKALTDAKAAGVGRIQVITDLNEAMTADLGGEKESTEFKAAEYRENETAERIKELRAAGFGFNSKQYGIFSHPLYQGKGEESVRIPLMHQKELFLVVENEKGKPEQVFSFYGTGNLSASPRYNRLYVETDPQASLYGLKHADLMIKTFRDGNDEEETHISSIPRTQPLRIVYGDGTYQELAYTDGHDNWNRRITALFDRALKTEGMEVKEVVFSHFVVTLVEVVEAMRKLLQAGKSRGMTVTGVLDDKFIDPHGFGLGAALAGYLVSRPMGKPVYPFSDALKARMRIFGYQRLAPNAVETTLEGSPGHRHLWHDKTTLVVTRENGQDWAYLFTGSFNLSGNKANAERQVVYRLRADSPIVRGFRESVIDVAENEKAFALPLEKAVFRNILSQLLGHSVFEIPVEAVDRILSDAKAGRFDPIERELKAISEAATTLKKKDTPEEVAERTASFMKFLRWYPTLPQELKRDPFLSPQGMSALMMAVTFTGDHQVKTWQQLQSIFWKPMPKEKRAAFQTLMETYLRKAWREVLGLDKPFPKFAEPEETGNEAEAA